MIKKMFFLLLAAMLLGSASAMAQSNTIDPVRGDVNGDGIVDVGDINAILKIMRDNGGVGTATTYYWYAGQTQPQTLSSNPTVDDTNFTNNKWHTLNGNQIQQFVTGGDVTKTWYVAVPASLNLAAKAYDMSTPDNTWIDKGTITVNGVSYKVWNIPTADEIAMVYMK